MSTLFFYTTAQLHSTPLHSSTINSIPLPTTIAGCVNIESESFGCPFDFIPFYYFDFVLRLNLSDRTQARLL